MEVCTIHSNYAGVPHAFGQFSGVCIYAIMNGPSERNPSAYEFPVFQAGPRVCLGMNMAVLEAKLCIVHLISQFDFVPSHKCVLPPRYNARFTQSVRDGLPITVVRR